MASVVRFNEIIKKVDEDPAYQEASEYLKSKYTLESEWGIETLNELMKYLRETDDEEMIHPDLRNVILIHFIDLVAFKEQQTDLEDKTTKADNLFIECESLKKEVCRLKKCVENRDADYYRLAEDYSTLQQKHAECTESSNEEGVTK